MRREKRQERMEEVGLKRIVSGNSRTLGHVLSENRRQEQVWIDLLKVAKVTLFSVLKDRKSLIYVFPMLFNILTFDFY